MAKPPSSPGRLSLLGQSPDADAPRGRRPAPEAEDSQGTGWRPDALGGSRHSRLVDDREGELSRGEVTPAEAAAFTAELCRTALRDFSPALVFLPPAERRRAQALAAYAFTLFDFARQRGVEGERLAQINRWEFQLEAALAAPDASAPSASSADAARGGGPGEWARLQPVFLAMAEEARLRPWPPEALDALADAARRRVTLPPPRTYGEQEAADAHLAGALLAGVFEEGPASRVAPEVLRGLSRLAGLLFAVRRLQDWTEELRQKRLPLPEEAMPPSPAPGLGASEETLARAARRGAEHLLRRLRDVEEETGGADLRALPGGSLSGAERRAFRFALGAARRLLEQVASGDAGSLRDSASLGLGARLRLLVSGFFG